MYYLVRHHHLHLLLFMFKYCMGLKEKKTMLTFDHLDLILVPLIPFLLIGPWRLGGAFPFPIVSLSFRSLIVIDHSLSRRTVEQ